VTTQHHDAKRHAFLIVLAVLVLPLIVAAITAQADTYCPERPGVANSPCIMPKNSLSVEVGLTTFTHDRPRQFSFADTLLRLGIITDVAEVRFGWDGELYDEQVSGAGDASLGAKLKLLHQDTAFFDVGMTASMVLNVGAQRFSASGNDPSLLLMAERDLSENVVYTGNFQVGFEKDHGRWLQDDIWASQLGVSLTDSWGVFGEVFGDFGDERPATVSLGGGATTLLTENLQIDFSFGLGLSAAAPDWFLSTGLAVRLPW